MVATKELRAMKFQDGLHLDIRPRILVLELRTYGEWKKAKAGDSSRTQGQSQQARSVPAVPVTQWDGFFCVDTPVGGPVFLERVCQGYAIEIAGRTLEFNFIVFDMTGFDIILGMDWISFFRATIDCFRGRVTVCTPKGDFFHFVGDRSDSHLMMIFSIADEESSSGSVYLAVVVEFLDIFPEELTELPSLREFVFAIDVIPGTAPISMAPYCMASAELDELKAQSDDLKAKGFIRPSASP
ncbi:uncharacterized protein LOC132304916 [Cornus florida]|uniref:uncharacterized protein LOC132304916 n=1 Tax=Cornus florida TaxID=4283 RepID=UPI00289F5FFB|nr:uncharacterized protein LOC132304916 [Cornus florida]